jgi:hypothetical protein
MSDKIQVWPGLAGYNVSSLYSKETITFSVQELLDLAEWIEQHREELHASLDREVLAEKARWLRDQRDNGEQ